MIRNIIFDWSGTLVDDLPAVWQATNFVMRQAGLSEFSLERFRAEFALPFTDFYGRVVPHISLDQLEKWFHSHFGEVEASVVELPHARDFLLFCQRHRIRAFVLSTVHPDYFARQATRLDFERFLERTYLRVWDKRKKIQEILESNRLEPRETLFIGDMAHDVDTAKFGGVHSCAVLTGYSGLEQLRAAAPDIIVEHLSELRQVLEGNEFSVPAKGRATSVEGRLPVITVGGLIFNSVGQVLMLRTNKWSGLWGIPGGKIRYGETMEAALERELEEETNLKISEIRFVLAQDSIESTEFYRAEHFVLLNYTCVCASPGPVRLNREAQEFRWVSMEEARSLPLNKPTAILLEAVQWNQKSQPYG